MKSVEIPKSPFYVYMTDKVLSNWGMAEGKINILIIPCDTREDAQIVQNNAQDRSDMKDIILSTSKPTHNHKTHYISVHSKDDYENWFIPNFFKLSKIEYDKQPRNKDRAYN